MGSVLPISPPRLPRVRDECSGCGMDAWCLPANLNPLQCAELDSAMTHRRRLARDSVLCRAGDPFESLFIVNSGSMKTTFADGMGHTQVTAFSLPGDIVGIEAIDSGLYPCDVVALEDSSCCSVRYADLSRLSQRIPALQLHLHRMMSREITRDYGLMFLLGSMGAEERLAQFVLGLSMRYAARGYSASQFRLCMSRHDIGNHLGLRLETISRLLSRLAGRGVIGITGREIHLKQPEVLRELLGSIAPGALPVTTVQ
jgi:CRP/FNR family transcriptional regulator